jgi:hypothetical protein
VLTDISVGSLSHLGLLINSGMEFVIYYTLRLSKLLPVLPKQVTRNWKVKNSVDFSKEVTQIIVDLL